ERFGGLIPESIDLGDVVLVAWILRNQLTQCSVRILLPTKREVRNRMQRRTRGIAAYSLDFGQCILEPPLHDIDLAQQDRAGKNIGAQFKRFPAVRRGLVQLPCDKLGLCKCVPTNCIERIQLGGSTVQAKRFIKPAEEL